MFMANLSLDDLAPMSQGLSVVDGECVVAVVDTVTEKVDAGITLADLTDVVQVVCALATGTVSLSACLQGEAFGYAAVAEAVAACQIVAGDDGLRGANLGDAGEANQVAA